MFSAGLTAVRVVDAKRDTTSFRPFGAGKRPTREASAAPSGLAWEEGYRAARAEVEQERSSLLALIAAADALQPEPSAEIAALIAETVYRLVVEIVGDMEIDRNSLIRRAIRAASLIGEADAARTMWLHPQDAALLEDAGLGLSILHDPAAERGSIRIDCSPGWIEHGTPLYLDALRAELGLTEVLTCGDG